MFDRTLITMSVRATRTALVVGLVSTALEPAAYDCVTIVTAHSSIDYGRIVEEAPIVVDLRNATGRAGLASPKVFKL